MRRSLVAPLTLACALALTACTGGDGAPDDAPSAAEDDAATEAEAQEGARGEDDGADDGEAQASGGVHCLHGAWEADKDAVVAAALAGPQMAGPQMAGAEATANVTGSSRLAFDDGTFTTRYDAHATELVWTLEGQEMSNTTVFDGEITGTWTATDTTLTLTDVDVSGLTLENRTVVAGEEIELDPDGMVLEALAHGGTSTYECTEHELRLTPVVEGTDTSSVVTVMHRVD